jgi:hypothetical protein
MAMVIHKPYIHSCQSCGRPVRQQDDQVRVLRLGVNLRLHWSCFIRELREEARRNADAVAEVVR